jgi:hypothetical protein
MAEEQKHGRRVLEAQARWFEMRGQSPEQQIRRLKETPSLRTVELFETVLESARSTGTADPHRGGATADVARELAELLRSRRRRGTR